MTFTPEHVEAPEPVFEFPSTLDVACAQSAAAVVDDAAKRAAGAAWRLDRSDGYLRCAERWHGYPNGDAMLFLAPGMVLHFREDETGNREFTLLTADSREGTPVSKITDLHKLLTNAAAPARS